MSLQTDQLVSVSRDRVLNRSLLEYANQNRNEGFFNDVNIKVANECFSANRMVLSCFSCVFERMFKVEMKERYEETVEVKEVDEQSMKILIDYIYTGHIDIDSETVMNLLAAADYLQLEDVKQFCFEFLISILSSVTWFAVFTASNLYHNDSFDHHLQQYLSSNLEIVSLSKDFKALSKENLFLFVSYLDRNKVEESSVYQAVITWVKFDETSRKTELADLLQLIKFEKISHHFCGEIISNENLITDNYQCMKLAFQAFSQKLKAVKTAIVSFGGQSTAVRNSFRVFNFHQGQLQTNLYPDFPLPLQDLNALKLNNSIFCVGGQDTITSRKAYKIDILNKNKKWQELSPPNKVIDRSAAASFDESIVVAGGCTTASLSVGSASVECYLKPSNKWIAIASLNQARSQFKLVSNDGHLYAVGGSDNVCNLSSVERLSNLQSKWEFVQSMQTARKNHAAVSYERCVYVFGGENKGVHFKSVEKYDPAVNEWSYVSNMNTERSKLAACVMDRKIYVIGGVGTNGFIKTIECYDPLKDYWNVVGESHTDLQGHSMLAM